MDNQNTIQEMIFGIHPVLEALRSDQQVDKLFVARTGQTPQLSEILKLAKENSIPVLQVPVEKLNRITRKNHQGVIALISPVTYYSLEQVIPLIFEEGRLPFILFLDRITDVRNFGAIARTAEAIGIDAIVIPSKGSVSVGADAVKTSAGALMRLKVCREHNLKTSLEYLKLSGLKLVAVTEKSNVNIWDAELRGPLVLMLGSEDDGISGEYLKRTDIQVKIPMIGQLGSLNVSVAAGIAMYEVVRQRQ
ncbi:MAG: 23S rRNA (guanosine(2251)-2'-O)-methyltransferase RlmB [Bacteroidales bacterium]|nr:23S rRNA (guanosine(2251)-2'-O)-methyltransferase RlmB [Bacteroidales bacterium]